MAPAVTSSSVSAGTAAALPSLLYSLFESCEWGGTKMTNSGAILRC